MNIDIQRGIHIRRLPEQLIGLMSERVFSEAKTAAARVGEIEKAALGDLSDMLRSHSPTITLVDPDLLANSLLEAIVKEFTAGTSRRLVASEMLDIYGPEGSVSSSRRNAEEYTQAWTELVNKIVGSSDLLINIIRDNIVSKIRQVTSAQLKELSEEVHTAYTKEVSIFSERREVGYTIFQKAATLAGRKYAKGLTGFGNIFLIKDPESMFSNVGGRLALGAKGFDSLRITVNRKVDAGIRDFLRSIKTESGYTLNVNKDARYIGKLVNFGHAGIYTQNKTSLIGINTPAVVLGGLISGESDKLESAIGSLPIHIDYGIELNTTFVESARQLLDLQINFAVSQPAAINMSLGTSEKVLLRDIVQGVTTEALRKRVSEIFEKNKQYIEELISNVHGSPSLKDYIADNIEGLIKGEPSIKLTKTSKAHGVSKTNIGSKPTTIKKTPANKTLPTKKQVTKPKVSSSYKGAATSLAALHVLLMVKINEQVRKNMGTGNATKVLNYRTGRFSESVKVTQLTQSRAGMISAFYTYMKMPYSTFSEGGAQQYPRSRDPKLLISSSIREIAASAAYNKLRAVLV